MADVVFPKFPANCSQDLSSVFMAWLSLVQFSDLKSHGILKKLKLLTKSSEYPSSVIETLSLRSLFNRLYWPAYSKVGQCLTSIWSNHIERVFSRDILKLETSLSTAWIPGLA